MGNLDRRVGEGGGVVSRGIGEPSLFIKTRLLSILVEGTSPLWTIIWKVTRGSKLTYLTREKLADLVHLSTRLGITKSDLSAISKDQEQFRGQPRDSWLLVYSAHGELGWEIKAGASLLRQLISKDLSISKCSAWYFSLRSQWGTLVIFNNTHHSHCIHSALQYFMMCLTQEYVWLLGGSGWSLFSPLSLRLPFPWHFPAVAVGFDIACTLFHHLFRFVPFPKRPF